MQKQIAAVLALLLVPAGLAACSGGAGSNGSGSLFPAATRAAGAPTSAARRRAAVGLRLVVPRKHGASGRFVSPSTRGITFAIAGPRGFSSQVTAGLTPTSPGCTQTTSGTLCRLTLGELPACPSSAPCYLAQVATYDAVDCAQACTIPQHAAKLSAAQNVAFGVSLGSANSLNVVLGGIPESVAASPLSPGYLRGDRIGLTLWGPAAQSLVVEALDADGNAIVGPGAPVIAVKSADSSLAVSGPSAASPNLFTLRASASGTPPSVTPGVVDLTASVTPAAGSTGTAISATIPVNIQHSILYVAGISSVLIYYDGNTTYPNRTIAGVDTGLSNGVTAIAADTHGMLYAVIQSTDTVYGFQTGVYSGDIAPGITLTGSNTLLDAPTGIAVDSNGTIYVTNGSSSVLEWAEGSNGNLFPSYQNDQAGSLLSEPTGIAVDGSGDSYVANEGDDSITEYGPALQGNQLNAVIVGSATQLSDPQPPAVLPDGTVCTLSVIGSAPTILEYAPGAQGNVAPVRTISGANANLNLGAGSIVADAAGTLYLANGFSVAEFPESASGNVAPAQSVTPGGGAPVISVAVVPPAAAP